jgi:GT2 family glycosyltransferase
MVTAIRQDERVGIVAAKLLRFDDPTILDSTGLFLNRYRRPYDRGQGEIDKGQYGNSLRVFGACGAAALYRRAMLVDIALDDEYFDEDFFTYYEDVDLAWRAQLRGWKGRYASQAVATHVRGWGDTLRKRNNSAKDNYGPRLALRNRYLMILKNDSLINFLIDLPLIILAELPRLFYMAIFAPDALMGLWDFISGIDSALKKRQMNWERISIDYRNIRSWFLPQRAHSK